MRPLTLQCPSPKGRHVHVVGGACEPNVGFFEIGDQTIDLQNIVAAEDLAAFVTGDDMAAALDEKADADDTYTRSETMTYVRDTLDPVESTLEEQADVLIALRDGMAECAATGRVFNGDGCVRAGPTVIAQSGVIAGGGEMSIDHSDHPSTNVQVTMWQIASNGMWQIPPYVPMEEDDDDSAAGGADFGDGSDGALVLNGGTRNIEDLFSNYDPDHNVPQWSEVRLTNGATLTTAAWSYNAHAGQPDPRRGKIVFKVAGTLSICANCAINANEKGYRGGRQSTWGYSGGGWGHDWKADDGWGPGGGRGGRGGKNWAHGAGGGGGSYGSTGQLGTPDLNRDGKDQTAHGGGVYGDPFLHNLHLGSGGGAGGEGHPGNAHCNPGRGGHGGGAIRISANEVVNSGNILANGGASDPNGWCNGNPQVGSGGGGSGGSIHIIANSISQLGQVQANGGRRGINQGWGNGNNRAQGQRGGAGGRGRIRLEYGEIAGGSTSPPAMRTMLMAGVSDESSGGVSVVQTDENTVQLHNHGADDVNVRVVVSVHD